MSSMTRGREHQSRYGMYDFRIEFMFQFENREEPELEAEIANCKNGAILENG